MLGEISVRIQPFQGIETNSPRSELKVSELEGEVATIGMIDEILSGNASDWSGNRTALPGRNLRATLPAVRLLPAEESWPDCSRCEKSDRIFV